MPVLKLFEDYTRREVHDIFSPDTPFTPSAGDWGLQGIVRIPGRPGDWVFMVTFGRNMGDHAFDEGINASGLFRWQSQPSQGFSDARVQEWVEHDEDQNSIYMFLRTTNVRSGVRLPYTYLGRLKYVDHDADREKPVHFLWQLLDWPINQAAMDRMQLVLDDQTMVPTGERVGISTESAAERALEVGPDGGPDGGHQAGLVETTAPAQNRQKRARGTSTQSFRARQYGDRSKTDAARRDLGLAGELLVVAHEMTVLADAGRQDLADKVVHVAVVEGDGAGYDVRSYQLDGTEKYIEVKTTEGPKGTDFFLSANELRFSEAQPEAFYLYRVYNYSPKANGGQFYVINGPLSKVFELSPTQYRVSNLNSDVDGNDLGGERIS